MGSDVLCDIFSSSLITSWHYIPYGFAYTNDAIATSVIGVWGGGGIAWMTRPLQEIWKAGDEVHCKKYFSNNSNFPQLNSKITIDLVAG